MPRAVVTKTAAYAISRIRAARLDLRDEAAVRRVCDLIVATVHANAHMYATDWRRRMCVDAFHLVCDQVCDGNAAIRARGEAVLGHRAVESTWCGLCWRA
jgi:hypothetical protein